MHYRLKLFLTFLLYGLLLALGIQYAVFKLSEKNIKEDGLKHASEYARELNHNFQFYLQDSKLKLAAIQNSQIFHNSYSLDEFLIVAKYLFLDIANTADKIMQLRYIDSFGYEKIRIDRADYGETPFAITNDKLQNKANRYYFHEIMKLKKGEYWFSKIDLNIEHGVVEEPIKPVLRIGTPFYHQGKKKGILITNIFMKDFLDKFVRSEIYDIYLVDKDGYILVESKHKNDWNRYLSKTHDKQGFFIGEYKYETQLTLNNGEGLKIVLVPDTSYLKNRLNENMYALLWILLIVILVSFPLSYILSILPSRLTEALNKANIDLEKESKEQERRARIDQLTQIYNRLYIDEVLQRQYYRFGRNQEKCTIIMLDIDFFKEVNDTYGHLVGDKVLVEFALLLKEHIRFEDVVGRWGGEEFLIILPHTDVNEAKKLAKKLLKLINEFHFSSIGHRSASMGIATLHENETIEQWVEAADKALYKAKHSGRNTIVVSM
jgi:diguanylate cyclase (GGDEF)-like protein